MDLSKKALNIKPSTTLSILAKAKKLKSEGIDVVNFSGGEPDFPTPGNICDAAVTAIGDGFTKYTDSSGTLELRSAICKKLSSDNGLEYEPAQIVVSNGAKHALFNALTALLDDGDEAIIPSPYWLSYPEIVKICGGQPVIVETHSPDYKISVADMKKALTPKTKVIIINSPTNPTGVVYNLHELTEIAAFAKDHDLFVISDEIYEKLIYDENAAHISIASLDNEIYKRTIVINGFSKSYSMTGWRVGYSASDKNIARVISGLQSHCSSNVNSIAQKAALAALTGTQDTVLEMKEAFTKRRDYICERLKAIPSLSFIRPQGAFYVFIDISGLLNRTYDSRQLRNANDFAESLLDDYNVAVVPGEDFGGANFIRISFPVSIETIGKGMDRLAEFIDKIK